ncbi:MAG: type VI secretion system tip protein VgrG, partial [Betaproteobacteria bacterium HGW-Betaproteobacteria-4]
QALPLQANSALAELIATVDPKKDGKFESAVGGQTAKKAQPGSRDPGEPTERFAKPVLVMEAPSDIGLASPASTLLFAGRHVHATSQQDLHLASAHTLAAAVGKGASWFSHAGGIKSIAAAGSQTIQANTDAMEILADQSITVTSSNDEIHILAKEKIVLLAGQSSVTLEGSNITFACPGTFSVKGSGNAFMGPGRGTASLEGLPEGKSVSKDTIELDHRYHDDDFVSGAEYEAILADGSVRKGKLDPSGKATLTDVPLGTAKVRFGPASAKFQRKHKDSTPNHEAAPSDKSISALVDKYASSLLQGDKQ